MAVVQLQAQKLTFCSSLVMIRDGLEVITVVKKPSQILPFRIVNVKKERIVQASSAILFTEA